VDTSSQIPTTRFPVRPDGSFDPFQGVLQIEDILNAVPDRITSHNFDQFSRVLSYFPAAEIASRLSPSAVRILSVVSF